MLEWQFLRSRRCNTMPSFEEMQKMYQAVGMSGTVGENLKNISDDLMDLTWDNDIQAKKCYIYDFYHDDQPDKNQNMTYDNTTKTPIDAKFIINSYQSIDKDQVPYYLQFRPSQKYSFSENDDLYYYAVIIQQFFTLSKGNLSLLPTVRRSFCHTFEFFPNFVLLLLLFLQILEQF